MAHVYHEIFLHLNWHTKNDYPFLAGPMEAGIHALLEDRCRKYNGIYLWGIGGTDTHVHLAVSIEPSVTIREMVRNLKGGSSHDANEAARRIVPQWQRGFGVVSFGKGNLQWVLDYIHGQREHHGQATTRRRLEQVTDDEAGVDEAEYA